MKYSTTRDEQPEEVKYLKIFIGLDRYRLTETNQGRLKINKTSDGDSDSINIHPCVGNEIEIF